MEIAYYILKELKKKGADDVVIEFSKDDSSQIKFSNNKIVKTGSEILYNLGIFMVKDKRIVTTTLKDFNKKDADKVINNLIKFSKNVKPNLQYNGIAEGSFKYKEIKNGYDKNVLNMNEFDLVEKGINKVLEKVKRADGIFEKHVNENLLLTSNNVHAEDKATNLYFSIRAFASKEASGHMNS
ncbi:MAG: hypothetical protein AABX55_03310, partial [Nanoarchaeota archaeon]